MKSLEEGGSVSQNKVLQSRVTRPVHNNFLLQIKWANNYGLAIQNQAREDTNLLADNKLKITLKIRTRNDIDRLVYLMHSDHDQVLKTRNPQQITVDFQKNVLDTYIDYKQHLVFCKSHGLSEKYADELWKRAFGGQHEMFNIAVHPEFWSLLIINAADYWYGVSNTTLPEGFVIESIGGKLLLTYRPELFKNNPKRYAHKKHKNKGFALPHALLKLELSSTDKQQAKGIKDAAQGYGIELRDIDIKRLMLSVGPENILSILKQYHAQLEPLMRALRNKNCDFNIDDFFIKYAKGLARLKATKLHPASEYLFFNLFAHHLKSSKEAFSDTHVVDLDYCIELYHAVLEHLQTLGIDVCDIEEALENFYIKNPHFNFPTWCMSILQHVRGPLAPILWEISFFVDWAAASWAMEHGYSMVWPTQELEYGSDLGYGYKSLSYENYPSFSDSKWCAPKEKNYPRNCTKEYRDFIRNLMRYLGSQMTEKRYLSFWAAFSVLGSDPNLLNLDKDKNNFLESYFLMMLWCFVWTTKIQPEKELTVQELKAFIDCIVGHNHVEQVKQIQTLFVFTDKLMKSEQARSVVSNLRLDSDAFKKIWRECQVSLNEQIYSNTITPQYLNDFMNLLVEINANYIAPTFVENQSWKHFLKKQKNTFNSLKKGKGGIAPVAINIEQILGHRKEAPYSDSDKLRDITQTLVGQEQKVVKAADSDEEMSMPALHDGYRFIQTEGDLNLIRFPKINELWHFLKDHLVLYTGENDDKQQQEFFKQAKMLNELEINSIKATVREWKTASPQGKILLTGLTQVLLPFRSLNGENVYRDSLLKLFLKSEFLPEEAYKNVEDNTAEFLSRIQELKSSVDDILQWKNLSGSDQATLFKIVFYLLKFSELKQFKNIFHCLKEFREKANSLSLNDNNIKKIWKFLLKVCESKTQGSVDKTSEENIKYYLTVVENVLENIKNYCEQEGEINQYTELLMRFVEQLKENNWRPHSIPQIETIIILAQAMPCSFGQRRSSSEQRQFIETWARLSKKLDNSKQKAVWIKLYSDQSIFPDAKKLEELLDQDKTMDDFIKNPRGESEREIDKLFEIKEVIRFLEVVQFKAKNDNEQVFTHPIEPTLSKQLLLDLLSIETYWPRYRNKGLDTIKVDIEKIVGYQPKPNEPSLRIHLLLLAIKICFIQQHIPYDTQLISVLLAMHSKSDLLFNIAAGEGKTLIEYLLAFYHALEAKALRKSNEIEVLVTNSREEMSIKHQSIFGGGAKFLGINNLLKQGDGQVLLMDQMLNHLKSSYQKEDKRRISINDESDYLIKTNTMLQVGTGEVRKKRLPLKLLFSLEEFVLQNRELIKKHDEKSNTLSNALIAHLQSSKYAYSFQEILHIWKKEDAASKSNTTECIEEALSAALIAAEMKAGVDYILEPRIEEIKDEQILFYQIRVIERTENKILNKQTTYKTALQTAIEIKETFRSEAEDKRKQATDQINQFNTQKKRFYHMPSLTRLAESHPWISMISHKSYGFSATLDLFYRSSVGNENPLKYTIDRLRKTPLYTIPMKQRSHREACYYFYNEPKKYSQEAYYEKLLKVMKSRKVKKETGCKDPVLIVTEDDLETHRLARYLQLNLSTPTLPYECIYTYKDLKKAVQEREREIEKKIHAGMIKQGSKESQLSLRGIIFVLPLEGSDPKQSESIFKQVTKFPDINIITPIPRRGTNFDVAVANLPILPGQKQKKYALQVFFHSKDKTHDEQIMGRTGRRGQRGKGHVFSNIKEINEVINRHKDKLPTINKKFDLNQWTNVANRLSTDLLGPITFNVEENSKGEIIQWGIINRENFNEYDVTVLMNGFNLFKELREKEQQLDSRELYRRDLIHYYSWYYLSLCSLKDKETQKKLITDEHQQLWYEALEALNHVDVFQIDGLESIVKKIQRLFSTYIPYLAELDQTLDKQFLHYSIDLTEDEKIIKDLIDKAPYKDLTLKEFYSVVCAKPKNDTLVNWLQSNLNKRFNKGLLHPVEFLENTNIDQQCDNSSEMADDDNQEEMEEWVQQREEICSLEIEDNQSISKIRQFTQDQKANLKANLAIFEIKKKAEEVGANPFLIKNRVAMNIEDNLRDSVFMTKINIYCHKMTNDTCTLEEKIKKYNNLLITPEKRARKRNKIVEFAKIMLSRMILEEKNWNYLQDKKNSLNKVFDEKLKQIIRLLCQEALLIEILTTSNQWLEEKYPSAASIWSYAIKHNRTEVINTILESIDSSTYHSIKKQLIKCSLTTNQNNIEKKENKSLWPLIVNSLKDLKLRTRFYALIRYGSNEVITAIVAIWRKIVEILNIIKSFFKPQNIATHSAFFKTPKQQCQENPTNKSPTPMYYSQI